MTARRPVAPSLHHHAPRSPIALVAALLAGVLCLLGAVTPDVAHAATSAAAQESDGRQEPGPQAPAVRGSAESSPHAVRALLRTALAAAGPSIPVDPDAGAAGPATVLPALAPAEPAAAPHVDGHRGRGLAGPSDRAPPRTAGT